MGIDIGGAFTIAGASGAQVLKIAGSVDALTIDTTGRSFLPNQPGFFTGIATDPGWLSMPAAWTLQNWFNQTVYNKQGLVGSRFTAPVTGRYLFIISSYHYKPGGALGDHSHNGVRVNGAEVPPWNINGYAKPSGYSWGEESSFVISLVAGDYAEMWLHSNVTTNNIYRAHSQWGGYLVG